MREIKGYIYSKLSETELSKDLLSRCPCCSEKKVGSTSGEFAPLRERYQQQGEIRTSRIMILDAIDLRIEKNYIGCYSIAK
jgi:hypothetical protein